MGKNAERGFDWVRVPVIAIVARLLCHAGRIRDATPRQLTPSRESSRSRAGRRRQRVEGMSMGPYPEWKYQRGKGPSNCAARL
jgi:hypothetical protein